METKQKTLDQCLNETAKLHYDCTWQDFEEDCAKNDLHSDYAEMWRRAAELYASQFKQSSPVSLKVEEAANDSAGGLTNEGTTFERAEHIEGFKAGAKWQSQQPLSIAWMSDEEINRWFDINANEPGKMGKNMFRVCVNNIQSELRKRVNAVDTKEAMLYVFDNLSSGLSRNEVENRINDYLTEKTK